jgi:hypothetical protein
MLAKIVARCESSFKLPTSGARKNSTVRGAAPTACDNRVRRSRRQSGALP